jgi:eukaryotic-like serine/threonine-protein kinase
MRRKLLGDEHPDVATTLEDLAVFLRDQRRWAEARAVRHEALLMRKKLLAQKAESGDAGAWNSLAWLLATDPDPEMRDGPSAVGLAERAVALTERKQAHILDTLAAAYAEAGQYTNAVKVQKEAIALLQNGEQKKDYASRLRLYESGSPYHDHGALAEWTRILLSAGEFAEAERLARECLAIRQKQIPDDWRTFNARSMLGGSLLGQKKYAEAEPLLVTGYEGMKQREAKIPAPGKPRLKEALQRLAQLYEETGQSEKAAEWRQKLADTEKAAAGTQPGTP